MQLKQLAFSWVYMGEQAVGRSDSSRNRSSLH